MYNVYFIRSSLYKLNKNKTEEILEIKTKGIFNKEKKTTPIILKSQLNLKIKNPHKTSKNITKNFFLLLHWYQRF